MRYISIAIDGPSGAGKSTVARAVAEQLGALHLDTGAMYRAFGWKALQEGLRTKDEHALDDLSKRIHLQVRFEHGRQQTLVDGQDVSAYIRTPEVSMAASDCSSFASVRTLMVKSQRELSKTCSMVVDGRDIGTNVLPMATVKIFLTASAQVRAQRRYEELCQLGKEICLEDVMKDVIQRDKQDTERTLDPLQPAEDAIIIDTSSLTQSQVVEQVLDIVAEKTSSLHNINSTGNSKHIHLNHKPEEKFTFLYRVVQVVACLLFRFIFPIRYHNTERAQLNAPFILLGNHNSMLDPLIVGWKVNRYQIRYLGKAELVQNSVMRAFFKGLTMISVSRHNSDLAAVRACLETLKQGHVLGVFPEGTRKKEGLMDDMESGIAMITLRAGVPILPAYLTDKPRLFRPIDCYYGDLLDFTSLAKEGINKSTLDAVLQSIRDTYYGMRNHHQELQKKV